MPTRPCSARLALAITALAALLALPGLALAQDVSDPELPATSEDQDVSDPELPSAPDDSGLVSETSEVAGGSNSESSASDVGGGSGDVASGGSQVDGAGGGVQGVTLARTGFDAWTLALLGGLLLVSGLGLLQLAGHHRRA